jgi:hypothetical protein
MKFRFAEHASRKLQARIAGKILFGNPFERRPLGKLTRIWEDNIKIAETDFASVEWNALIEE